MLRTSSPGLQLDSVHPTTAAHAALAAAFVEAVIPARASRAPLLSWRRERMAR